MQPCVYNFFKIENEVALYHPHLKNGRFESWDSKHEATLLKAIKWKLSSQQASLPDQEILDQTLPINHPDFTNCSLHNNIKVTWIGHATVLINIDGINILTDPIFSEYASPIPFIVKRYRKVPCSVDELPEIHAVVISHNHYDHLDVNSIYCLYKKFPNIYWFIPKNLKSWLLNCLCSKLSFMHIIPYVSKLWNEFGQETINDTQMNNIKIMEFDWWESKTFIINKGIYITFIFLPAKHWCKRTINDNNMVLWGGWGIKTHNDLENTSLKSCLGKSIYFAGDTGFGMDMFQQIHSVMGNIDFSALPIGAYKPQWVMKDHHINPEEAVQIHTILHSKYSLGIHWGTFALSDEPYLEPKERLRKECERLAISDQQFFTLFHGETKTLDLSQ